MRQPITKFKAWEIDRNHNEHNLKRIVEIRKHVNYWVRVLKADAIKFPELEKDRLEGLRDSLNDQMFYVNQALKNHENTGR